MEHSLCYQTSLTDNEIDQVLGEIPSQNRQCPIPSQFLLLTAADKGVVVDIVEILQQTGQVDINQKDSLNGHTALMNACIGGNLKAVKLLLDYGADPNIIDNCFGYTALIYASIGGHITLVELLLQQGANPNIQDVSGFTALMLLPDNSDQLKITELLLQKGADPNILDDFGCTALMRAAMRDLDLVNLLLKGGAEPNLKSNRFSALMAALMEGNVDIMEKLLQVGADDGVHALIEAVKEGYITIIELLIKYGVDINAPDPEEHCTALTFVASRGTVVGVNYLINEAKANVNAKNKIGNAPLFEACRNSHVAVIELLLEAGADINGQNEKGQTALIWASENDKIDMILLLLKAEADVNIYDQFKFTALMRASKMGHIAAVAILLQAGVNVHLENESQETALSLTTDLKIIEKIENYVKDLPCNIRNAAITNDQNKLKGLLPSAKSQDFFFGDRQCIGYTALVEAAMRNHEGIVKLLIKSKEFNTQEQLQHIEQDNTFLFQRKFNSFVRSAVLQVRADELLHPRRIRTQLISAHDQYNGRPRNMDEKEIRGLLCNVRKLARKCEKLEVLTVEGKYFLVEDLTGLVVEMQKLMETLDSLGGNTQINTLNEVVNELYLYMEDIQATLLPLPIQPIQNAQNIVDNNMMGMFETGDEVSAPDDMSSMLESHITSRDQYTYYSHDTAKK